jgi:DNA-binding HxlR family transcriptional regulator
MHRTRLDDSECPVARSLDMIGEWWSLLIIRDALRGLRRFEEFQESLGIARNMLSRRLKALVAAGILEKRAYVARPPRYDYQLTAKGEELLPVVVNLHLWGNRWAAPSAGPAMLLVDRTSGVPIEPALSRSGPPIENGDIRIAAGPGAGPETRATFARLRNAAKRRPASG